MVNVIIKYKKPVSNAHIDTIKSMSVQIVGILRTTNIIITANITPDKLGKLKLDPDVEYVELDQEVHIPKPIVAAIKDKVNNLNMGSVVTTLQSWGVNKIRAQEVWSGYTGHGVNVCIMDTGIDYTNPVLAANYKGGINIIANTNDPKDDNGHGSHVSSIAGASDNSTGVAPNCDLYSIKVLDKDGNGTYSAIMMGIDWAMINNMKIINMSFGGSVYSKAMEDQCLAAYNAGILLVAAAGNNGTGNGDTIGYPAKFNTVVAVGATDEGDGHASFSSVGVDLEVSAPGVNIPGIVPTDPAAPLGDPTGRKNLSGTSMACPHYTGAAALVLEAFKSNIKVQATNVQVRAALTNTAVDLGTQGKDIFYGAGRIDVKSAIDHTPPPPPQPTLTTIVISPAIAFPRIGFGQQFGVTALDQNNNPMPAISINWSSSLGVFNPQSIVTGPDGRAITVFTATTAGTSTVTASSGNVNGHANITVISIPTIRWACRTVGDGAGNILLKYCAPTTDPNAEFDTQKACQDVCKKTIKKYNYELILDGNQKVIGYKIILSDDGQYTGDEMCQIICAELKSLSKGVISSTYKQQ